MHTTVLKTVEFGEVRIHHNADWSGPAHVCFEEAGVKKEVEIPGRLLIWVGQDAAKQEIRQKINRVLDTIPEQSPNRDMWDDI